MLLNCQVWAQKRNIAILLTPWLFNLCYAEASYTKTLFKETINNDIESNNSKYQSPQYINLEKYIEDIDFAPISSNKLHVSYLNTQGFKNDFSTYSTLIFSQLPNPIRPRQNEQNITPPQELPVTPLDLSPSKKPSPEGSPKIPGTIIVKEFNFIDNTAFTDEELNKYLKKDLIGKEITFDQLLQVEDKVIEKYTEGCDSQFDDDSDSEKQNNLEKPCYLNSTAVIPANIPANQSLSPKEAVVTVQIIEGGLEDIKIQGTQRLNQNYIKSRLQSATSKPLEQKKLLKALQLLQLDPLIQNLSAELSAGSRPELSLLEVKVTEADSFLVELFTDNSRTPSVGSWRRGVQATEGNLLGFGDRFGVEYVNTDGSNALDLSYSAPLTAKNTTINIRGGITSTEVIEEPFDRAEILGDSFNFELGVRQPIYRISSEGSITEIGFGFSVSRQESNTEVLGENFALSPGADANGETRISALRFSQDYSKKTLQDVFAVRSQFNIGLDIFDSTVNEDPLPDSRFFAWRGQGQYVRRIGRNSLVVLRSDLQFATSNLVPLEQFSVGGLRSVRGYRQDTLLTDNGFFTSAEARLAIFKAPLEGNVLSIVPFFDLGIGWNNDNNTQDDPEENVLLGLGLGLLWSMGDKFNARIDYGIPLTDVEDNDNTLQEEGIYFSVSYSPF